MSVCLLFNPLNLLTPHPPPPPWHIGACGCRDDAWSERTILCSFPSKVGGDVPAAVRTGHRVSLGISPWHVPFRHIRGCRTRKLGRDQLRPASYVRRRQIHRIASDLPDAVVSPICWSRAVLDPRGHGLLWWLVLPAPPPPPHWDREAQRAAHTCCVLWWGEGSGPRAKDSRGGPGDRCLRGGAVPAREPRGGGHVSLISGLPPRCTVPTTELPAMCQACACLWRPAPPPPTSAAIARPPPQPTPNCRSNLSLPAALSPIPPPPPV